MKIIIIPTLSFFLSSFFSLVNFFSFHFLVALNWCSSRVNACFLKCSFSLMQWRFAAGWHRDLSMCSTSNDNRLNMRLQDAFNLLFVSLALFYSTLCSFIIVIWNRGDNIISCYFEILWNEYDDLYYIYTWQNERRNDIKYMKLHIINPVHTQRFFSAFCFCCRIYWIIYIQLSDAIIISRQYF